uniref:Protein kinase domain-containing protein n=1 Tax=Steinernema glaseri TaxID=37863 RepID=A0A1I7YJR8_9BILA
MTRFVIESSRFCCSIKVENNMLKGSLRHISHGETDSLVLQGTGLASTISLPVRLGLLSGQRHGAAEEVGDYIGFFKIIRKHNNTQRVMFRLEWVPTGKTDKYVYAQGAFRNFASIGIVHKDLKNLNHSSCPLLIELFRVGFPS